MCDHWRLCAELTRCGEGLLLRELSLRHTELALRGTELCLRRTELRVWIEARSLRRTEPWWREPRLRNIVTRPRGEVLGLSELLLWLPELLLRWELALWRKLRLSGLPVPLLGGCPLAVRLRWIAVVIRLPAGG